MEDRILRIVHTEFSRRNLLRGALGTAALVAAPFGNFLTTGMHAIAADLPDDIAILNFALTLEHLEDVAYRQAIASGKLTGRTLAAAQFYGRQEAEHVTLLTNAIRQAGKTPVAEQAKYNFPAFTDEKTTVGFLRVLEDTGVGAYTGAARFIKDKGILTVAGGIVQVEARHASALRIFDGMAPVPGPLDKVLTPDETLAAAKPILG